jgi:Family of unknown function (DUF5681)
MPFRPIAHKNRNPRPDVQRSETAEGNSTAIDPRPRVRRPASLSNDETANPSEDNDNTASNRNRKRKGQNWNDDGSYKVGKGKPSPNHYFPKGKSGNPNGRPKGRRSINAQASAIFDVKVPVKVNGETRMLDATGVMLTKLYELGAKGKLPAITQVLAIQRERYPEPLSTTASPLSSDELSLIDTILTEAGFAASPVSRAGRSGRTADSSKEEEI